MGVMTETKINGISLVVAPDANAAAAIVADRFASLITANPQAVLGLATGGTPVQTYQQLVQKVQQGQLTRNLVERMSFSGFGGAVVVPGTLPGMLGLPCGPGQVQ